MTRIGNQIEPNDYPYIAGSEGKLPAICGLLSIRSLTDELPAISGSGSRYSWKFIRDDCVFFYSVEHALVMLITRYVHFIQSIRKSPKKAVQFLLEKVMTNVNSLSNKNMRFILEKTQTDDFFKLKPAQLKKTLKFCEIPAEEKWKVDFLKEIINTKQGVLDVEDFSKDDLDEIVIFLCTS